jgi:peptidoglycan/LPS O-acetylase OafA/YrhL
VTVSNAYRDRGRVPWLDGWRGLSILLVLFGHFVRETPLGLSGIGVHLFFVLSGRLMAEILFVDRLRLTIFFQRRLSRIFPALVVFVLLVWAATSRSNLAFKPAAVVAALTFTLNYAIAFHHGVAAIENLWSLCVEEHAYLLLGLLAFVARKGRFDPLWAVLALALASAADALVCLLVLKQPDLQVLWRSDAQVCSILLAVAAYLALQGREVSAWVPPVLLAATIPAAAAPAPVSHLFEPALASGAICTLHAAPALMRTVFSWPPLRALGVWSFSIYLWQQPFSRLALEGRLPHWIALSLGLLCGLASFYLIEQPARRWLNARWQVRVARGVRPAVGGSLARTERPA